VTFVTVIDPGVGLGCAGWDFHRNLERGSERALPRTDRALTALIDDLHERGLDKKVLLVVWREFGRTPKITPQAGCDHCPDFQSVLISGGGFHTGQVIGSSNSKGEKPKERPLWPYDILGIDTDQVFVNHVGRPVPILDREEAIRELL